MAYLSESSKKYLSSFLTELRKNLSRSVDRKKKAEKEAKFAASILGFTFRASDIKYDLSKEHISKEFKDPDLSAKFSNYLKKDLPLVLRGYNKLSLGELLYLIRDPEAKKGIYYYINFQTKELWYFSIASKGKPTLNQEESFRQNIISPLVKRVQSHKNKPQLYKRWLSDIELGHTFGFKGTSVASEAFSEPQEGSYAEALAKGTFKVKAPDLQVQTRATKRVVRTVNKSLLKTFKTEIFIRAEQRFQSKLNKYKSIANLDIEYRAQVVAPEEGSGNRGSGSKFKGDINKYIREHIDPAIEALKDEVTAEDLLRKLRSSPSLEDVIAESLIYSFKGRKPSPYKKSTTKKATVKNTLKQNVKVPITAWGGAAKVLGDAGVDLNSKIPQLNDRLHDKIQQNMGQGGSRQILNYRIGRFAKSAEIKNFYAINEKNAIGATVRYMKNPYQVFEPGGKLHLPGRDPHRIFGRSIRQLLQEEKIATFRRVKVDLNG